ncbi:HEXXH motif domain-containing protein [Catellatospora citrea]|uniref:HEXXH motif domain-containing protein n=1 Tax=Catellatospora citrea TaxID=53366 RepID=UPI0033D7B2D9
MAVGPLDEAAVRFLRDGQYSKNLQLIMHAIGGLTGTRVPWAPAVEVLDEVRTTAPELAAWLLTTPTVGAWAAGLARRAQHAGEGSEPVDVEIGYLHGLAAVGAARCGLDAELTVPVRDGVVLLPTMGAARFNGPDATMVRVTVRDNRVRLHGDDEVVDVPADPHEQTPGWLPLRELSVDTPEPGPRVVLDDLDPYRACYRKPVAARLSAAEAAGWGRALAGSWQLLAEYAPARAVEIAAGLRSLVPLSPSHAGPGLSATARTAFAAMALTLPEHPSHMAVTLVHEFQHSKLSALLDLIPLYDTAATDRYFAPWRRDPRPVGGLLQGAYAFLAVTGMWARLRDADCGTTGPLRHFAELRLQVDEVLATLAGVPHLNDDGRTFVGMLRAELDRLLAIPVESHTERAARAHLEQTRAQWLREAPELNRSVPASA